MRTFKFRYWDGSQMREPYCEPGDLQVANINDELNDCPHLMQYTGLKDANGVEIYEGDVIHASGNDSNYTVEFKSYEWGDDEDEWHHGWCLARLDGTLTEPFGNQTVATEYLTVIGNICENPELLEK